jgi:enoyl-CoA hydratase
MLDQDFLSDEVVIITRVQSLLQVVLNRPRVLNALDLDMIRRITIALENSRLDTEIAGVFIEGAGERAFCSGGDVKDFYYSGMDYRKGGVSFGVARLFFKEEYNLNKAIFYYPKPIIAFMNGITMGGGYGLAGHASVRIATDKTVFAMPETKLGFFPDVGSMFHLSRCSPALGCYLALTGQSISGVEMVRAGLADFYVFNEQKTLIRNSINQSLVMKKPEEAHKEIQCCLSDFSMPLPASTAEFQKNMDVINHCFTPDSLINILIRLQKEKSEFSQQCLHVLNSRSRLSLMVTFEHFKRCADMPFDAIIEQDYQLVQNFIRGRDFYEGIRATLIDKDNLPFWEVFSDENLQDSIGVYFKKHLESNGNSDFLSSV